MRAIFYERYGSIDVLKCGERPAPRRRSGWVRVQVEAALNPKDVLIRKGKMRWLARSPLPRIPGFDFSGTELVRSLGANHVIDYTQGPITETGLDCVFDIFGNLPWSRARGILRPRGRYCTTVPRPGSVVRGVLRRVGAHRAALVVVQSRRADLNQLARWIAAGELRPVTDCVVPMSRPELGHQRIETKRARGKVVIDVSA